MLQIRSVAYTAQQNPTYREKWGLHSPYFCPKATRELICRLTEHPQSMEQRKTLSIVISSGSI